MTRRASVGEMVAFKDHADLRLGKVIAVDKISSTLIVTLYRGTVHSVWKPVVNSENSNITMKIKNDRVARQGIFSLTKSNKLPQSIIALFKDFLQC